MGSSDSPVTETLKLTGAVTVDQLTRCFKETTAVDWLGLEVHAREISGLPGHNGPGPNGVRGPHPSLLRPEVVGEAERRGTAHTLDHTPERGSACSPQGLRRCWK